MTYYIGEQRFANKLAGRQAIEALLGVEGPLKGAERDIVLDLVSSQTREAAPRNWDRVCVEAGCFVLYSQECPTGETIDPQEYLNPLCHQRQVRFAMRYAVKQQVRDARRASMGGICPISGRLLTPETSEIHHEPGFSHLVQDFLAKRGVTMDDVEVRTLGTTGSCVRLCDGDFRWAWVRYHRKYAKLTLVHHEAHQDKHK